MFTDDQLLQIAIGAVIVNFHEHIPDYKGEDSLIYFRNTVADIYNRLKENESNNK